MNYEQKPKIGFKAKIILALYLFLFVCAAGAFRMWIGG